MKKIILALLTTCLTTLFVYAGPQPVFSTTQIDFGEVFFDQTKTLVLSVANVGDAAYIITDVSSNSLKFAENTPFAVIEPGDTLLIPVVYTPGGVGVDAGELAIQALSGNTLIGMYGQGVLPTTFTFAPDTIYVTVPSGHRETTVLTLTNTGASTLNYFLSYDLIDGLGTNSIRENFEGNSPVFSDVQGDFTLNQAVAPDAPSGSKVAEITGGNYYEYWGAFTPALNPTAYRKISYWFKTTPVNGASAIFRAYDQWNNALINCWADVPSQTYNFYVSGLNGSPVVAYEPNEWNHVEMLMDTENSRFSILLNGDTIANQLIWGPFSSMTRFQLSNWAYTTSYFDDIRLSTLDLQGNLISFDPFEGAIGGGQVQNVQIEFNAEGRDPGIYTGVILIENNASTGQEVQAPFVLEVTPGALLAIPSDTLDFGTTYVGIPKSLALPMTNLGSDALLVYATTTSDPQLSIEPAYGIIDGSDTLHTQVVFSATQAGYFEGNIHVQSTAGEGTVYARAQAVHPPVISITPDTVCFRLVRGQDTTFQVQAANAGLGDLTYTIADSPENLQDLRILAICNGNSYRQPLQWLRSEGAHVDETEIVYSPLSVDSLNHYDLVLFPRDDYFDIWVYMNWMATLGEYVENGGRTLFLGRFNGDILYATGLFQDQHGFSILYESTAQIIQEPAHPIFNEVQLPLPFVPNVFGLYHADPTLVEIAGANSSGAYYSLVAVKEKGAGASMWVGYDFIETIPTTLKIFKNSVQWLTGQLVPKWLSVDTSSGYLQAGMSAIHQFEVKTDSLEAAEYHYDVIIQSDDPLSPENKVHVKLTVLDRPSAEFSANKERTCDGWVQFSDRSAYGPETYAWDFGDGGVSNEPSPLYQYTENGLYTVSLTVCNEVGCDTIVKVATILVEYGGLYCDTLNMPGVWGQIVSAEACTGIIYDSGGPVNYYSNGESGFALITAPEGSQLRLKLVEFSTESCCDYLIIYDGDSEFSPYILTQSGSLFDTVTLLTTGNKAYVRFNSDGSVTSTGFKMYWECAEDFPPDAQFNINLQSCQNIVGFDNRSTGATHYFWDFGDGHTSTVEDPTHAYEFTGDYAVRLYAINGTDTVSSVQVVSVSMIWFYAEPDVPEMGYVGQPIVFAVNSPQQLSNIYWSINGFSNSGLLPVTATFNEEGVYPYQVEIYSANGCYLSYTDSIEIGTIDAKDLHVATISMRLQPNPVTSTTKVIIVDSATADAHWILYNAMGEMVDRGVWSLRSDQTNVLELNLSDLPAGVYSLSVAQADRTMYRVQVVKL